MKNKYVKSFDKFEVELKEGDIVYVQRDGEHENYNGCVYDGYATEKLK